MNDLSRLPSVAAAPVLAARPVLIATGNRIHFAAEAEAHLGGVTLCGHRVRHVMTQDGPRDYWSFPLCRRCDKRTLVDAQGALIARPFFVVLHG